VTEGVCCVGCKHSHLLEVGTPVHPGVEVAL
jgi:hypothetical protein